MLRLQSLVPFELESIIDARRRVVHKLKLDSLDRFECLNIDDANPSLRRRRRPRARYLEEKLTSFGFVPHEVERVVSTLKVAHVSDDELLVEDLLLQYLVLECVDDL